MKMLTLFVGICLMNLGIFGFQLLADNADLNGTKYVNVCIHSDVKLKDEICDKLDSLGGDISDRIRYAVQDGRIILLGYVKDEAQHQEVLNAVAKLRGHYVNLYDHIKIRATMPDTETVDAATTGSIKMKLMRPFNEVKSGDYAVTTFDGVVYVVGTADSESEKIRVMNTVKASCDNEAVYHINVRP